MSNIIDKIQISGQSYNVKDSSAATVVELTQQEYDNLPSSAKTSNTLFVITDAQAGDLTNYYTKTETNTLLGGKADTATTYTKTETDNAITAATSTKQDTLVSGTNIKTINNESLLGSGNINIQGGGGKAIEAGRGISITTGATADTVSFDLPISAGTGNGAVVEGASTTARGMYSHAEGYGTDASGNYSHAEGIATKAKEDASHSEGYYTTATNFSEHASGQFNASNKANNTWGDSGNTLFSVGNGRDDDARHNAFEIRQNGDIYLSLNGQDVKLQDHLGGGGVTPTEVQTMIDNSISGKQDTLIAGDYITIDSANTISTSGLVTVEDNEVKPFEFSRTLARPHVEFVNLYPSSGITDYSNAFTAVRTNIASGGIGLTHYQFTLINASGETIEGSGGWGDGEWNTLVPTNLKPYLTCIANNMIDGIKTKNIDGCFYVPKNGWRIARVYIQYEFDTDYHNTLSIGYLGHQAYSGGQASDVIEDVIIPELSTLVPRIDAKQDVLTAGDNISIRFDTTGAPYGVRKSIISATDTKYTAGSGIYISDDNVISATGGGGGGGSSYTAGDGIDITNDVISVTGKVDTSTYNTYTAATDTALDDKQDTLVSGTNIKTINNQSLLGSGNIDIQGGGASYSAGTNISIANDTISCTLPISGDSKGIYTTTTYPFLSDSYKAGNVVFGYNNKIDTFGSSKSSVNNLLFGKDNYTDANLSNALFGGNGNRSAYPSNIDLSNSVVLGSNNTIANPYQASFGRFNASNYSKDVFGDGGNTLFSVGNGTSSNARHNAFEIRQNGDIYLSSGGTDIKLQDHLGSGGGGITSGEVQTMIDESVSGKADTSAVTAVQDSLSGYVTTDTLQDITAQKTFVGDPTNKKKSIKFKQYDNASKVGFVMVNSAETNNEIASFEFRPNTFTIDNVKHPLLYFGHYRSTNVANAGVPQTVIGFRQYDQKNAAAYHYLMPLPEKAKTPFSLTTSFKDYFAPMGFKNGSTMITADDTGVVDLSSELGGLKLVKLTQSAYDALSPNYDSNTLYVIVN